ncbi:hypothetical protein K466DRAFT_347671 [Polyporus arcularius HHB13444]|uniref:Uncharacterized protein n=1 Tax=Polyporus arcularius HHB13444 TaxID=1314778 RepID=A0A5C3NWN8_9APHY|nr:hypothetical protein K466DRAFT_347671 [Polyporus arcularius HHB13444]
MAVRRLSPPIVRDGHRRVCGESERRVDDLSVTPVQNSAGVTVGTNLCHPGLRSMAIPALAYGKMRLEARLRGCGERIRDVVGEDTHRTSLSTRARGHIASRCTHHHHQQEANGRWEPFCPGGRLAAGCHNQLSSPRSCERSRYLPDTFRTEGRSRHHVTGASVGCSGREGC